MKNIFNSLSVQIIIYLSCLCPPFLSYISYLSLQVRLPALPVSTFVVLHIIPFSTGTSTCLAGVHLCCLTYHTFLYRYVYLPCRCPPFLSYISYLSLQVCLPALPVSTFVVVHWTPARQVDVPAEKGMKCRTKKVDTGKAGRRTCRERYDM
jgi:hypothetical protein